MFPRGRPPSLLRKILERPGFNLERDYKRWNTPEKGGKQKICLPQGKFEKEGKELLKF